MTNVTGQSQRVRHYCCKLTRSMKVCVCRLEHCWMKVCLSACWGIAHTHIWQPVLPCFNRVTAGIWIMSTVTLQAWLPRAVCAPIVGHCHFFNSTSPGALVFLSFPPYWNYSHDSERLCLKFRRLARERNRLGCDHVFLTAFVGIGLVFTLIRTFLEFSLSLWGRMLHWVPFILFKGEAE